MTPKEKAKELIARFKIISYHLDDIANHKECARVAVDEILGSMGADRGYMFWTEVKQEIEKL
jgi:hypothetical protein